MSQCSERSLAQLFSASGDFITDVRMRALIPIGILIFLVYLPISAQSVYRELPVSMNDFPIVGTEAPYFTLEDLSGNSFTLYNFIGKPLVINFWTTWCGVCVHELPLFEEFYERYGDQVNFLAICSGTTPEAAKELMAENHVTFPVLYDDGRVIAGLYQPPRPRDKRRIIAFPFTVFIDMTGTVVYARIGAFASLDKLLSLLRAAGFTITEPESPPPPPPDINRRGVSSNSE